MSFTETARVLLLLLTVSAVRGQKGWGVNCSPSEICALKGSSVEIICKYSYPPSLNGYVQDRFWFTKYGNQIYVNLKTDPDVSNRVRYDCNDQDHVCRLTITDLRESDSAEYKFKFITNQISVRYTGSGVTLSVTDLKVHVGRSGASIYAQCGSSCLVPNSTYVWYKNDQNIVANQRFYFSLYSTNSLSCSIKGHEKFRSRTLYMNKIWGWTCTSNQICAIRGSTVKIHCTYRYKNYTSYPVQKISCLKDNQNWVPTYRVQCQCDNNECTLSIPDISSSDSAEYKFRLSFRESQKQYVDSPAVNVSVTDPQLKVILRKSTNNRYPLWDELTCHSDCKLPDSVSYIWYKYGKKLEEEKKYFLRPTYDSANGISCALKGYEQFRSLPVWTSYYPHVSVSPSEILEGSSVTLTCSRYANSALKYTWYKKHGNQDFQQLSTKTQHVFRSIQSSDSGVYYCTVESSHTSRTSISLEINVKYPPKLSFVSVYPSGPIKEGKPLNLTCISDANPAATYTWYKDNKLLSQSREVYSVSFVTSKDRGNYICMSENHYGQLNSSSLFVDVLYAPKPSYVSVSPSGDIVVGGSVTLTCSSDANPAATYTWYKDNKLLSQSRDVCSVSFVTSKDRGNYICMSENHYGQLNSSSLFVDVLYAPKPPYVSVSPSGDIVVGSSVTLTCSCDANPAANYTWYKQDEKSPEASGQNFTINNIKHKHSGNYYCRVENKIGHKNSTVQVAVVAEAWTSVATGTTVFVLLVIIIMFFLVFFLMKKRKPLTPSAEPGKRPDTSEQSEPHHSEEQEDLHYGSVQFLRNQNDCLYMNIRSNGACRPTGEENESTEYSTVKCSPRTVDPSALYSVVQRTEAQRPVEDSSALYSVINHFR